MMPLPAIAYVRSGAGPDSNDSQHRAIKAYAENNGIEIVAVHADSDAGGRNTVLESLKAAVSDLAVGRASILVVEDIDRLGRDIDMLSETMEKLAGQGVEVHTVSSGLVNMQQIIPTDLKAAIFS